jgi:hypothetical protein
LNASKGFAWLSFLPYIIGAVAVAGTVYAGYRWYHGLCNDRCRIAEERATLAEETIKVAQARATHLALLWARAVEHVETRYVERIVERETAVTSLRDRVGRISSDVLVPIDTPTLDLLRDITEFANNAPDTPAAGGDQVAPEAVPQSAWVDFALGAAEAYRDAADKHLACVAWANSITQAQEQ